MDEMWGYLNCHANWSVRAGKLHMASFTAGDGVSFLKTQTCSGEN